jgi:CIC family chloride channel protein
VGRQSASRDEGGLPVLALLALSAGGASGLICAGFRLVLAEADRFCETTIAHAHNRGLMGFLLVTVGAGLAVAVAAWLVRRFSPYASGSGIPQVEAALDGQLPPPPPHLILVKFFVGVLAIGREGPSVQMGAVIAHMVGKVFGRSWPDRIVLLAAGAGAGLAVAFNAPMPTTANASALR